MNDLIEWMAAEAERPVEDEVDLDVELELTDTLAESPHFWQRRPEVGHPAADVHEDGDDCDSVAHSAATAVLLGEDETERWWTTEDSEEQRQRRIYRGRTVAMLRKYMQYSIETGRMPSLLGREFFRSKVTSYTVVTFEDRVIFVHDMETSLDKLDEFSRQLIARHILQEHDLFQTARLLKCNEKTIRRLTPIVIDQLSEILLDVGLMERVEPCGWNSCQGGKNGPFSVSDCDTSENKF